MTFLSVAPTGASSIRSNRSIMTVCGYRPDTKSAFTGSSMNFAIEASADAAESHLVITIHSFRRGGPETQLILCLRKPICAGELLAVRRCEDAIDGAVVIAEVVVLEHSTACPVVGGRESDSELHGSLLGRPPVRVVGRARPTRPRAVSLRRDGNTTLPGRVARSGRVTQGSGRTGTAAACRTNDGARLGRGRRAGV